MNCIEVETQIDLLLSGEVSSPLSEKSKNHLASCRSCGQTYEKLLLVDSVLAEPVSVPRMSRMDARIMQAFDNHYRKNQVFKQPVERPGLFRNWRFFPKTSFAVAAILFAVLLGLAFQLGRMSASGAATEISKTATINQPDESGNNLPNHSPESIAESQAPTMSPAIPLVKEKIITRVIYIKTPQRSNGEKRKGAAAKSPAFLEENKRAPQISVQKNEFVTVATLKGFQSVSNSKAIIIRKGENNED